jgi:hypothetical protein
MMNFHWGAAMQKKKFRAVIVILACLLFNLAIISPAYPGKDSGKVPKGWALWSCWYWPWHDDYNPNLYDPGEALERYDVYAYWTYGLWTAAQDWEYSYHGPPQQPDSWWGHCHAWSAASIWEQQPKKERNLDGVKFRVRDRKGLLTETYFTCADGTNNEIFVYAPSPGLFWRYLRDEIKGVNPMHGHGMGLIGEMYYGDEVWNYPIYKYSVKYNGTYEVSGTMTIYVANESSPVYADSIKLYYQVFTYEFTGVMLDSNKNPTDSGRWVGSGPYHRPHSIWRPYYAETWMQYVENPELNETILSDILN